ncbi:PREDICTED: uncharacterized protein At3g60930, chloroplastic-like [Camelina sativa]|uniref:Uncharacterized protein At3g60930, chloroplastic-like n=1 Tax=Camelina sativa TaxID=90675 RepID=A0ABM1RPE6_CAMSA|nr:PREDICTED: uncharacterized protein At3g60930, chloroplastic-like [Camelina sativa]
MSPPKSSSGKAAKPLIPGVYGPHQPSNLSAENLAEVRGSTGIPPEVEIRFQEAHESPENPPPGYCCAFEIFFSACGLSFPLPELIVKMMFELGFTLPQMCPNFVRTVMCLQTLGEEFDYQLSLADFLQVYTVKTGRTKGTLYVSPLSGLKVFDDLPEKDEKWRKSYFFFPVNEFTFSHRTSSYITSSADCFAPHSQSSSQDSAAKVRSLGILSPAKGSGRPREERACRIAEKEAKKQMAAALAEGKARIPNKNSSSSFVPEVSGASALPTGSSELGMESTRAPAGPLAPPVIVIADSADEPREVATPPVMKKTSAEVTSQQADSSKKRKEPKTSSSSRERSRARTGSLGDERSKSSSRDRGLSSERRSTEAPPPKESGDSSGRNPLKEQRPFARAPPASPADLMRSYIRPGVRIPAFAYMTEVNRANFFGFADKIGELMIEFNSSVASYEDQLFASPSSFEVNLLQERIADLEAQVKEYARLEAKNASTVAKAEQIRARMKKAEIEVLDLGVANKDLRGKLKKAGDLYFEAAEDAKAAKNRLHKIELCNQLPQAGNSCEIERVRREERQEMRRTLRPLVEEVRVTFEEREKLAPIQIRAAEIRANRMLIEEISRGEIQDMEAELGLLKADEEEADEKVSKVTPRDLDLSVFSDLLADTPDLLCS